MRSVGVAVDQLPALPSAMNPEQLQSLQVLALALVPVVLIWWAWLRLLR